MRTRLALPFVAAALVTVSACGGGGDSSSTVPADADVVVTAVEGIAWDKKSYTASAGEVKIVTINSSSAPHNLHVLDAGNTDLGLKLDIPAKGDQADGTLTLTAGTYTLICTIPGHSNMKAELVVS